MKRRQNVARCAFPESSERPALRFDERDNVQARNTFEPGSAEYREFYGRRPELEAGDIETRELSLKMVGSPLDFLLFLQLIENLGRGGSEDLVDDPVPERRLEISPERATEKIKGFVKFLGADLVRVGPLDWSFVYSHVGKTWHDPGRPYGKPIILHHRYAISVAVGLNPGLMKTGPVLAEAAEVMRVYTRLATISKTPAGYIGSLGYPARAHIVSNYQVHPDCHRRRHGKPRPQRPDDHEGAGKQPQGRYD
jgi:hypothetical protein